MSPALLDLFYAWSAFLSAVATLITLVTGILFFARGERFGRINDAASVFQMLLMLPIAAALSRLTRTAGPVLGLLTTLIGITGMLVAATLQALLVFRAVRFEDTLSYVLAAGGAVGLWLVVSNSALLISGDVPAGLALVGIVVGAGYILLAIGWRIGGEKHPLSWAGAGLSILGYSVWAIWLGRLLHTGAIVVSGSTLRPRRAPVGALASPSVLAPALLPSAKIPLRRGRRRCGETLVRRLRAGLRVTSATMLSQVVRSHWRTKAEPPWLSTQGRCRSVSESKCWRSFGQQHSRPFPRTDRRQCRGRRRGRCVC